MACDIQTLGVSLYLALRFAVDGQLPIDDPGLECRTESQYGTVLRGSCMERDAKVRKLVENWVANQLSTLGQCIRQGKIAEADLRDWKWPDPPP